MSVFGKLLLFSFSRWRHLSIFSFGRDPISTANCSYVSARGKWTTNMTHGGSICHLWSQKVSLSRFLSGVESAESVIMLLKAYHSKSVCNQKLCCLNCPHKASLFLSLQLWSQSANNVFCSLGVNMYFHFIKKILCSHWKTKLFQKFSILKMKRLRACGVFKILLIELKCVASCSGVTCSILVLLEFLSVAPAHIS